MRNYNWLLLAISVAVHLAVIGSLQLNIANSTPTQSSILLQLHPPIAKAQPPKQKPKPRIINVPLPVVKQQASKKPASAIPASKPAGIPTVQVETRGAGSSETTPSTAEVMAKAVPKPTPIAAPKLQPTLPALPKATPLPLPDLTLPPSIDIAGLLRDYAGGVKREILAAQSYPTTAKRLGHEGTVQVGFTIAREGSLATVHVKSSSGFDSIDNAAIGAVQAAAPFMAIPKDTNQDSLSMSISLKYYLE